MVTIMEIGLKFITYNLLELRLFVKVKDFFLKTEWCFYEQIVKLLKQKVVSQTVLSDVKLNYFHI